MTTTIDHNYGTVQQSGVPPMSAIPVAGIVRVVIKDTADEIVGQTTTTPQGLWRQSFQLEDGTYTVEFAGSLRPIGTGFTSSFTKPVSSITLTIPVPLTDPIDTTPPATGEKGDAGETGVMGLQGPSGPAGLPGLSGGPGLAGETGPMGPIGLQGSIGTAGSAGARGLQGPPGPQGSQGPVGPQGPAGAAGGQGPIGPIGSTGPDGATGVPGVTGVPGLDGSTGPIGPTGPVVTSHGALSDLDVDDHTQYLLTDGTRAVSGNFTIGIGAAGVDYALNFNGETTDGLITWMEDEDEFDFNDDINLQGGEKLRFDHTLTYIKGEDSGQRDLGLYASQDLQFYANELNIAKLNASGLTIGGGATGVDYALNFDGETTDGIITWMEDEDYFKLSDELMMDLDRKIYFRSVDNFIHSDVAGNVVLDALTQWAFNIGGTTKMTVGSTGVQISSGQNLQVVDGESDGFFESISFSGAKVTTKAYMYGGSATMGFVCTRAGSITDFGTSGDCTTSGIGASYDIEVRKNGVNVWQLNLDCNTMGDKSNYATQARGTDAFVAGDIISFYSTENGIAVMDSVFVNLRIQYD